MNSIESGYRLVFIDEILDNWWFRWYFVRVFITDLGLSESENVMVVNGKVNSAGKGEKHCGVDSGGNVRILVV